MPGPDCQHVQSLAFSGDDVRHLMYDYIGITQNLGEERYTTGPSAATIGVSTVSGKRSYDNVACLRLPWSPGEEEAEVMQRPGAVTKVDLQTTLFHRQPPTYR